jgi:uncharacterized cupin superfamily protein
MAASAVEVSSSLEAPMTLQVKVKVEKPSPQTEASMKACPTWSCGAGVFNWFYDQSETCLLLAGDVCVTTEDGDTVNFAAGDLVTFPQGLRCTWDVRVPVHKHFRFD